MSSRSSGAAAASAAAVLFGSILAAARRVASAVTPAPQGAARVAGRIGFTILDPLAASLLGVFLFGEHIRTDAAALAGQALALAMVIAGATALSRSCLILGENQHPACPDQPTVSRATGTPDREPAAVGRP